MVSAKLSDLQKDYNAMVEIATSSMQHNVPLTPNFQRELILLTKVIKSMGGKA